MQAILGTTICHHHSEGHLSDGKLSHSFASRIRKISYRIARHPVRSRERYLLSNVSSRRSTVHFSAEKSPRGGFQETSSPPRRPLNLRLLFFECGFVPKNLVNAVHYALAKAWNDIFGLHVLNNLFRPRGASYDSANVRVLEAPG